MRKPNTQKILQNDLKTQMLQQANAVSEFFKKEGYASEFDDDIKPATRAEVAPPAKPEKNRFNPDQIVDIVTFIEHPYFCNLKPYPWQKLISIRMLTPIISWTKRRRPLSGPRLLPDSC